MHWAWCPNTTTSTTTSSAPAFLSPTENDGSDRHYRGGFGSNAVPILMLLVRPAVPVAAKRRACPTLLQPALSIGVPRGCAALDAGCDRGRCVEHRRHQAERRANAHVASDDAGTSCNADLLSGRCW